MTPRRKTRQVTLGDDAHGYVRIGGNDSPVSVQSMTAGYTMTLTRRSQRSTSHRAKMTSCVAVPEKKDTAALRVHLVAVPTLRMCTSTFNGR
jgi:4-hydroxy-3-methylbut-2-en-1-yl diphosphate synthase IspG/GcpE